jgi:hypothetical protein
MVLRYDDVLKFYQLTASKDENDNGKKEWVGIDNWEK